MKDFLSTQSYAFRRSSDAKYVVLLFSFTNLLIMEFIINEWSVVLNPFKKPICSLLIKSNFSMASIKLSFKPNCKV